MSSLSRSFRSVLPRIITGIRTKKQVFALNGGIGRSVDQCSTSILSRLNAKLIRTSVLTATKTVTMTFVDREGDKTVVKAKVGESLLDVAKDNDIDLEGACEGTLACSTCHLIFDDEQYERIGLDPPSEEELDMLDLAYGLTDTSRLGCQIEVTEDMEGLVLTVPSGTTDVRNT